MCFDLGCYPLPLNVDRASLSFAFPSLNKRPQAFPQSLLKSPGPIYSLCSIKWCINILWLQAKSQHPSMPGRTWRCSDTCHRSSTSTQYQQLLLTFSEFAAASECFDKGGTGHIAAYHTAKHSLIKFLIRACK